LHVSGLGPRRPLVWVGPSWHIDGATLVQNRSWVDQRLCFGDVGWSDYDLTCEVRRTSPQNNLGVIFRATGDTDFNALILCPTQAYADIHRQDANPPVRRAKDAPGVSLATGVWRKLRIEVRGFKFRCFLDGAAVLEFEDEQRWNPRGGVGFWSWNSQGEFRDLKVAAPDGKALWEGWPDLRALGNERAHYVYQHDNGAKGSIRHLNGKVWEEKTPSGTFRFTEIERSPEIIGLERPGPNGKILLHLHWGHAYVSGGREWKRWATGNWQR